MIQRITELSPYWTEKNFEIHQFEVDVFINVTTTVILGMKHIKNSYRYL